jgi:nicotinate-nucleotide pyrophosphorylase
VGVEIRGGVNHRYGLFDHDFNKRQSRRLRRRKMRCFQLKKYLQNKKILPIEIEVRNLDELREV